MFSSCFLGMAQIITWILKLMGYWLNLEQMHHRPRELIQNRWLMLLKHMYLSVMSGNFGFQDQMDYISIHQAVGQYLGGIVHLFADEISYYLCVGFYS